MFRDLTFQQFCALDYCRNMVVTAGPGAGKTRILSHRFCFILLTDDSVSIPQILTLTFTEKAAEEMKGRIYSMLSEMEREFRIRGNSAFEKKIRNAKEQFHNNNISTIHSFCARLLRDHPVESMIDSNFSVIDGVKKQRLIDEAVERGVSKYWKKDNLCMIPLLQSFGGHGGLLVALRNSIEHPLTFKRILVTGKRLFGLKDWDKQVFRDYCDHIEKNIVVPYFKGIRKMEDGTAHYKDLLSILEDWHLHRNDGAPDSYIPFLFTQIRNLVKNRKVFSSRLPVADGLKEISYADLPVDFFPDLFAALNPDLIFKEQFETFVQIAKVCLDEYENEKKRINALDFADLEARSYNFLSDLFERKNQHEMTRVQKRFKYIMVDEFQDTNRDQWDIIRFLCSSRDHNGNLSLNPAKLFVVGDKRQAIYKFRGGDVTVFENATHEIKNSNQRIADAMFWDQPMIAGKLSEAGLLNAETEYWHKKAFELLSHGERKKILEGEIYLPHNFRSCTGPIGFINKLFIEIFGNKGVNDLKEYEISPREILMPEYGGKEKEGSISLYLTHSSNESRDRIELTALTICEIIESIMGIHGTDRYEFKKYPDIREKIESGMKCIGILFFSFNHLKIFETVFRESGLPFMVHRGKGFFRCHEIMDLLQLLKFISDERELIPLLAALRSPIFGVTDPELFDLFYGNHVTTECLQSSENHYLQRIGKQINSWRILSSRLTLVELIRRIIEDRYLVAINSSYPDGAQRIANLEKFVGLARRFQEEGEGSLKIFTDYCLRMAEEDEEEGEAIVISDTGNPIILMTIHAAKGLEFPMVIIPELERKIPVREKKGKPLRLYSSEVHDPGKWNNREGEIPVWPVEIPQLGHVKKYTPLGYLLKKRDLLENMAENRRVFYVGCTRAMDHLILSGHMNKKLMERKTSLTQEDYRERATIMELLADILQLRDDYPQDHSDFYAGGRDKPDVFWRDLSRIALPSLPIPLKEIDRSHFAVYDREIRERDLSEPIKIDQYVQLSFRSLRIFRECPLKFYYEVILGARIEDVTALLESPEGHMSMGISSEEERDFDDNTYGSKEALFIGSIIHEYLEKHRFGNDFDQDRFEKLWNKYRYAASYNTRLNIELMNELKKKVFSHLKLAITDMRLKSMLQGGRDYSEVPFLITVSDGCEFRGVIDRLFKDRGRWTILDWKSNDLKGKDPVLLADKNDYNLQLACYRWAAERILGEKVERLFLYFTDTGQLVKSNWKGNPREIIDQLLSKIREYGMDRDKWAGESERIQDAQRVCNFCEFNTGGICGKM